MRILHVSREYGNHCEGGLGTFVTALVRQQSKCNLVHILLVRNNDVYHCEGNGAPNKLITSHEELQVIVIKELYDVIHFHDWHGHKFVEQLSDCGAPIIYTSHLPSIFEGYDKVAAGYRERFDAERTVISKSRFIVANSKFTLNQMLAKHNFYGNKGRFILNGIDFGVFFDGPIRNKKYDVIAAGRMVEQKGFPVFLDACSLIGKVEPTARFAIAGAGELLSTLQTQSVELGIEGSIDFVGRLSQTALAELFRSSDIVAVPSIYEPFGLVAVEAMACGAGVVASDTGGLREIVEHGHNGLLVDVGSADALAGASLHLMHFGSALSTLRHRGLTSVMEKFAISRCAEKYHKLYKQARGAF